MLNEDVNKALNEQINAEIYSSYLYLSMEVFFTAQNLNGFSNWMRAQVQEELTHVAKTIQFLNDRNCRVELQTVQGPPPNGNPPLRFSRQPWPTRNRSPSASTASWSSPWKRETTPLSPSCNGSSPNRSRKRPASRTSSNS